MRARVGGFRTGVVATAVAVAVLSLGVTASALPDDSSSSSSSSTVEPDDSTPPDAPTTSVDPFGEPATGDPLVPGSRPGSTVQTRTPPPPPTTTTTTTLPLVPPSWILPWNSGSGRRVVYSKTRQRVWAVDSDGTILKTHLVSGRLKWCDPRVGTYSVFSRSRYTNSIQNPAVKWGYMIRFTKGCNGGNIGFHEIPKKYGVPLQSIWQLGQPLSAGCVRQGPDDARWMWNWAWVGTKVVVLP